MNDKDLYLKVKVSILRELVNPFSAWGLEEISRSEILACLAKKEEQYNNKNSRKGHIQKIAYFVKHGWNEPGEVDVGVPCCGYIPDHILIDGNHRFAAAAVRGDEYFEVGLSGQLSYAKELGIYPDYDAKATTKFGRVR